MTRLVTTSTREKGQKTFYRNQNRDILLNKKQLSDKMTDDCVFHSEILCFTEQELITLPEHLSTDWHCYVIMWQDVCTMRQEQFEHTHVVIASCKSKKNIQYTNTKETYWSTKHYQIYEVTNRIKQQSTTCLWISNN
jgi:hypothetical protein